MSESDKPPFPPFTRETAVQKVRAGEAGWTGRDPIKVAAAYTIDSWWRNRSEFVEGREEIIAFLTRKWAKELEYRLIKEMWAFDNDRIAVRFAYEYHDPDGAWFRAFGNENWQFDEHGLMRWRHASINDVPIQESERKFFWDRSAPRPLEHPGLSSFGF
ncbi:MAG: nuclear transport factor 2 family protein [Lacisediminihabitans sp.]